MGKSKWTIDLIKEFLKNEKKHLHLTLLADTFTKNTGLLKVKCNECDEEFGTSLNCIMHNNGCIVCGPFDKPTMKLDDIRKLMETKFMHLNLNLIDDKFINIYIPLKFQCKQCDDILNITLSELQNGLTCYNCRPVKCGYPKLSIGKVKEILKEYGLTLIGEYTSHNEYMELKCDEFGHLFKRNLTQIKLGRGCTICKSSTNYYGISEEICRGFLKYLFDEDFIRMKPKWVTENGFIYDGYCDKLRIAFEYNGKQHYEHIVHFHKTIEDFKVQQENDKKKIKLCADNNVSLLIIPYTVNHNDILQYIKNECDKLKIKYPNKPHATVTDLKLYNSEIITKNKALDDKLIGTTFVRMENFTNSGNTIKIKCTKCNEFEINSRYSRLINRIPPCKTCYGYEQIKILDEILKECNFKIVGEYLSGKRGIDCQCLKCGNIHKYRSDYIKEKKGGFTCTNCSLK